MDPGRTPKPCVLLLAVVVLGVSAAGAAGQKRSPAEEEDPLSSFGDVIDSYLVNVEVWVSDGKGRPITGLTAEDFELREDGRRVEVTHFAEIRGVASHDPVHDPESAPAPTSAVREPLAEVPGHLVLYFDQIHLSQAGRKRIIADLREFLASGGIPAARILIVRQSHDLSTVVPFGSTRAMLEAGLDRLAGMETHGTRSERDKRLVLKRLQLIWDDEKSKAGGDPCSRFPRRAMGEIEMYAELSGQRIATSLSFLGDAVGYLSAVPGVKTFLYFGDRLETTPGRDLLAFIDAVCPPGRRQESQLQVSSDMVESFSRLTRHANTNRVTFYPVQTAGLRPSFLMSADMSSNDLLTGGGRVDFALRSNEQAGLSFLATRTGGRASFNRNRFGDQLARIAEEMSGYYSLAYVPPSAGDGREHDIEVKIRDGVPRSPGGEPARRVEVRHRRGYRDTGAVERMAERLEGAVHLGLVANPLGVRLGAGVVTRHDESRHTLPLHVLVPAENATYLPRGEVTVAQLTLIVTAYDEQDRLVASARETFRIEQPSATGQKLLDLVMEIEIGTGPHVVAVGLCDEASRETSYVSTAVEVRSPESQAL